MLYWLYETLKNDSNRSFFEKASNVLQYQTFRSLTAGLLAMFATLVIGNRIILKLLSLKMGQPIRTAEEVRQLHALHEGKKGTPTMGGIMILLTLIIATLLCANLKNPLVWVVLYVTVSLGLLGFWDDYLKVSKKNSKGVSGKTKLAVQFAVAASAGLFIFLRNPEFYGKLWLPFLKTPVIHGGGWMNMAFFILLFAGVIVGSSNAVNLTDGLDGLAIGCTIPTALTYAVFCYLTGNHKTADYLLLPHNLETAEVAIVGFALLGSAMGFLWFNCAPARVFMGDTGSLAIGGAIGSIAICCKQEMLLLIVGFVFVAEALSVMLQVAYFKYTRRKYGEGRRLLRMSPLHHHFELAGWKETQVVVRFWILSVVCALAGLATLKLR
ncbi:MAG: phospho-N-acetylmuramoyl-pentapeptide-transferase [Verrucomicrobiales bacterium]|nr:phospho-N-acetylmuramoyl-pentapeptide-transferase [Verrucomicrobiales bacterium]